MDWIPQGVRHIQKQVQLQPAPNTRPPHKQERVGAVNSRHNTTTSMGQPARNANKCTHSTTTPQAGNVLLNNNARPCTTRAEKNKSPNYTKASRPSSKSPNVGHLDQIDHDLLVDHLEPNLQ